MKVVPGPIELKIEANRCDLKMTQCEKYPGFNFNSTCQRFKDKRSLFHEAWLTFKPPFECPFTPQKYVTKNASIDFSLLAPMPISGYAWLITVKLVNVDEKRRETALCILFEIKVIRAKGRQRN